MVGLLLDQAFGCLFLGKFLNTIGVWMHSIVAAIVVYDATRSTVWVGLVIIVQYGPQLVLDPLSVKLADRGDLLRQIIRGRLLSAASAGGLSIWVAACGEQQGVRGALPVLIASLLLGWVSSSRAQPCNH